AARGAVGHRLFGAAGAAHANGCAAGAGDRADVLEVNAAAVFGRAGVIGARVTVVARDGGTHAAPTPALATGDAGARARRVVRQSRVHTGAGGEVERHLMAGSRGGARGDSLA